MGLRILILAALMTGCVGTSDDDTQTDETTSTQTGEDSILSLTGDAGRGQPIYGQQCQACHGADGSGGTGSDLTATVPDLTREDIVQIMREGIPGTTMVAYTSILSNQQIADVVEYVIVEFGE
jgi:cytochrome c551